MTLEEMVKVLRNEELVEVKDTKCNKMSFYGAVIKLKRQGNLHMWEVKELIPAYSEDKPTRISVEKIRHGR